MSAEWRDQLIEKGAIAMWSCEGTDPALWSSASEHDKANHRRWAAAVIDALTEELRARLEAALEGWESLENRLELAERALGDERRMRWTAEAEVEQLRRATSNLESRLPFPSFEAEDSGE